MKKLSILSLLFILISAGDSVAANFAVITSPPTMLNMVVLFVAVGCLVGSFKILELLKGGQLFKCWQLFILGFVTLVFSQAGILLRDFEILAIPSYVVPALLVITIGSFLMGVFETKKTLS